MLSKELEAVFAKIDDWQKMGYEAWKKQKRARACELWQLGWNLVSELIQSGQFASIEAIDKVYRGSQSIGIWAVDFGEALYLCGLSNTADLPASIAFNRQILAWSERDRDINSNNRRRMIAESTFRLAGAAAGDAIYGEFLNANPRWGWGWASWADQYGFDSRAPWHSLERAEEILRRALRVEDLDNRNIVLERLRDILLKLGRPTAAAAVEISDTTKPGWRKWFTRKP